VSDWSRLFNQGKRFLRRHRPEAALDCFVRGLEVCPDRSAEAARITYYMGLAHHRLGNPGRAIASWIEAQRQHKGFHQRKMLERFSNSYGMPKRETESLDDWHAFFALHLSRYLESKHSQRLDTRAEADMIRELIEDNWNALVNAGVMEGKSVDEKFQLFSGIVIIFPYFSVPEHLDDRLVHVDFKEKRRIRPQDRCPCGSGLPFKQCCGRIPTEDEIIAGGF
jgi:tetratricopeptide (TPR) repeat protein